MKGLQFLSLILLLAGCGQREAKREFERAVVALKVCAESSTSTQKEFHEKRAALQTCFELHKAKLSKYRDDYSHVRFVSSATDEVWQYFNTAARDRIYVVKNGNQYTWCWAAVLSISPELKETIRQFIAEKNTIDAERLLDNTVRGSDPNFRASTHVERGRDQTASRCENLLARMR